MTGCRLTIFPGITSYRSEWKYLNVLENWNIYCHANKQHWDILLCTCWDIFRQMREELYYLSFRGWCEEIPGEGGHTDTRNQTVGIGSLLQSDNQTSQWNLSRTTNVPPPSDQLWTKCSPPHSPAPPSRSQDCSGEPTSARYLWYKLMSPRTKTGPEFGNLVENIWKSSLLNNISLP